ncbi:MAG: BrnT family toxin [Thiothrix sp.]|nr:MAG: BrnT family toxin [Thiothrix sp.]
MKRLFEWDKKKAEANYRKHGIRFEEAALVFDDPLALSEQDRVENGEARWQTIGLVGGCLLVLVAHTVWEEDGTEVIRIISARPVNRKERKRYEQS